jgi:hypothetical protein
VSSGGAFRQVVEDQHRYFKVEAPGSERAHDCSGDVVFGEGSAFYCRVQTVDDDQFGLNVCGVFEYERGRRSRVVASEEDLDFVPKEVDPPRAKQQAHQGEAE